MKLKCLEKWSTAKPFSKHWSSTKNVVFGWLSVLRSHGITTDWASGNDGEPVLFFLSPFSCPILLFPSFSSSPLHALIKLRDLRGTAGCFRWVDKHFTPSSASILLFSTLVALIICVPDAKIKPSSLKQMQFLSVLVLLIWNTVLSDFQFDILLFKLFDCLIIVW